MPLPGEIAVEASSPASPVSAPKKDQFFYGGQAVIEGVMMRGKHHYAVAVRLPKTKEIVVDRGELKAAIYVNPMWKLPMLRGLALIGEQLHLGMKSLMWSANMNAGGNDVVIGKKEITGSVAFAAVFGLGLFLGLPLLLAGLAVHRSNSFLFVVVEGIIRVGLVLGYLSAIALLPDVRRVFQYHGAEHKTIAADEAGAPLTPESIQRFSKEHPRCGTGFLLVVVVVSIFVFALFGRPPIVWRIVSRIVLVPVVAALSYELIKFSSVHKSNALLNLLVVQPSLALQSLTTREPDAAMIEVAVAALQRVKAEEMNELKDRAPSPSAGA